MFGTSTVRQRPYAVSLTQFISDREGTASMLQERVMTVRRVATESVLRMVAAGVFCSVVPFFVVMGVFAGFGKSTLRWNGAPVYGLKAVLLSPMMGVLAAAVFTVVAGFGIGLGLWIYSKLKPFRLKVLEDDATSSPAS
jgi:hypothetical protein